MTEEITVRRIMGQKIYLRSITYDDCNGDYLIWINDRDNAKYLTSSKYYTADDLQNYVNQCRESGDHLFGIFLNGTDEHVGNICLNHIDQCHRRSAVGIIVGSRQNRLTGIGSEALKLALQFAFHELDCQKVYAGTVANNLGARKLFLSAGFAIDGLLRRHFWDPSQGEWLDCLELSIMRHEFLQNVSK